MGRRYSSSLGKRGWFGISRGNVENLIGVRGEV